MAAHRAQVKFKHSHCSTLEDEQLLALCAIMAAIISNAACGSSRRGGVVKFEPATDDGRAGRSNQCLPLSPSGGGAFGDGDDPLTILCRTIGAYFNYDAGDSFRRKIFPTS
eukprot:scaffold18507_cov49-Attheya_sp.AAC.1